MVFADCCISVIETHSRRMITNVEFFRDPTGCKRYSSVNQIKVFQRLINIISFVKYSFCQNSK